MAEPAVTLIATAENVDMSYVLPVNTSRVVAIDTQAGKPVDTRYQSVANRIPPQTHY